MQGQGVSLHLTYRRHPHRPPQRHPLTARLCQIKHLYFSYTVIQEPNGTVLWVPNNRVANGAMRNMSAGAFRLDVGPFDLAHGVDLAAAKQHMLDAAIGHVQVLPEPMPRVLVAEVMQSAIRVAVRVWVSAEDQLIAPFNIREAVLVHLLKQQVPLATWRPHVASTLQRLTELGYPGIADGTIGTRRPERGLSVAPPSADGGDEAVAGAFATHVL